MPTVEVQPRQTPAERHDTYVSVDLDDALTVHVANIDGWIAPRQNWEFTLREGHESGRANNVEAHLLYAAGEGMTSLSFRLDQLDASSDLGGELVLRFEERDGIAKLARLTSNGIDVELHHILTYT